MNWNRHLQYGKHQGNQRPAPAARLSAFVRLQNTVACLLLLAGAPVAAEVPEGFAAYLQGDYDSAYENLAPAAADSPVVQNLVGLMLYYGQGASADPVAAHDLFHRAAEAGVPDARINLGILHSIGAPRVQVDYAESRMWFTTAAMGSDVVEVNGAALTIPDGIVTVIEPKFAEDGNGKRIYLTFCAGCHGFSGMRFFPYAPSFAMGERMTKSNAELMNTVLRGKGLMPSWEDKLALSDLEDAVGYLRELALRTAYGTDTADYDQKPDVYYIFNPTGMRERLTPDWATDPVDDP